MQGSLQLAAVWCAALPFKITAAPMEVSAVISENTPTAIIGPATIPSHYLLASFDPQDFVLLAQ